MGSTTSRRSGEYGPAPRATSLIGHLGIVQILLENGADVDAQGGYYSNALQAASLIGHLGIFQMPIEKGADINAQGGYYGNALQAAVARGCYGIVQMLIEKGANINAQGGYYGQCSPGRGGQRLLRHSPDAHREGSQYQCTGRILRQCSQAAAARGYYGIVQMLIEKGSQYRNAQGGNYGNALQAALAEGHLDIVHILLEKGANTNTKAERIVMPSKTRRKKVSSRPVRILLEKGLRNWRVRMKK